MFCSFEPSPSIIPETFTILENFVRNVKIQHFVITETSGRFEPSSLCDFLRVSPTILDILQELHHGNGIS